MEGLDMAMSSRVKAGLMMNGLFRSLMVRDLMKDARKFVRRNMKRVDVDSDYWLHRAGLTRYHPMRRTFGSLGLLVLGGIGGAVAALALAPKPGAELRSDVKQRAKRYLERAQQMSESGAPGLGARA